MSRMPIFFLQFKVTCCDWKRLLLSRPNCEPGPEPGPNIKKGLAKMSAAEVMAKFVPNSFWRNTAIETNAYRRRWEANGRVGDADQEVDPIVKDAPYDLE